MRNYWHPALGGGICLYEDEWYRNWEFDYEPPEKEIVMEEPENIKDIATKETDLPPQPQPPPLSDQELSQQQRSQR